MVNNFLSALRFIYPICCVGLYLSPYGNISQQLKLLIEEGREKGYISFERILEFVDEDSEELITQELKKCTEDAIKNFIHMRETEGEKIREDLIKRIEIVSKKVEEISQISSEIVSDYIAKLEKRVNELLKPNVIDETRLTQEIVIFSDKCSIEEEITRLKSHISQFMDLLDKENSNGKRIDFLIQEMNRETNTIGSKANNLKITNYVVDIKTELENIREQIQNIE